MAKFIENSMNFENNNLCFFIKELEDWFFSKNKFWVREDKFSIKNFLWKKHTQHTLLLK